MARTHNFLFKFFPCEVKNCGDFLPHGYSHILTPRYKYKCPNTRLHQDTSYILWSSNIMVLSSHPVSQMQWKSEIKKSLWSSHFIPPATSPSWQIPGIFKLQKFKAWLQCGSFLAAIILMKSRQSGLSDCELITFLIVCVKSQQAFCQERVILISCFHFGNHTLQDKTLL